MNIDTRMIVVASIVAAIAVLTYMMVTPENGPGAKVTAPPAAPVPAATSPATTPETKEPDTEQPGGTAPSTP
jgi:hypothetical protein